MRSRLPGGSGGRPIGALYSSVSGAPCRLPRRRLLLSGGFMTAPALCDLLSFMMFTTPLLSKQLSDLQSEQSDLPTKQLSDLPSDLPSEQLSALLSKQLLGVPIVLHDLRGPSGGWSGLASDLASALVSDLALGLELDLVLAMVSDLVLDWESVL